MDGNPCFLLVVLLAVNMVLVPPQATPMQFINILRLVKSLAYSTHPPKLPRLETSP